MKFIRRIVSALCLALLSLFLFIPSPHFEAFAQEPKEAANSASEDEGLSEAIFSRFNENANRAAKVLSAPVHDVESDEMADLEALRADLAKDRDLARTMANRGTLNTRLLQAQLAEIGPPPADGSTEALAITTLRKTLDERLAMRMAPVIAAREADVRASTLVKELDDRITAIEHKRSWERGYSLIDPRLWIKGLGQWGEAFKELGTLAFTEPTQAPWAKLGLSLLMLVFGPVILAQSVRRWLINHLQKRFLQTSTKAGKLLIALAEDLIAAVVLFFAIALGFAGLGVALSIAWPTEQVVAFTVVTFLLALIVAVGAWIGRSTIRSPFPELRLIQLSSDQARRGVRLVNATSAFLGLEVLIDVCERYGWIGNRASDLASALIVLAGSYCIWKLADVIASSRGHHELLESEGIEGSTDRHVADRALDYAGPFSRLLKLLAIAVVGATLVGFPTLARDTFASMVGSLALIATAVFLHRSIKLVLTLLAEGRLAAHAKSLLLLPIATGFIILLGTIPLLAVIWGYRSQEIGDAILALRTGISFGEITLSIGDVVTFAAVFFAGYLLTRWVLRILKQGILPQTGMDIGVQAAVLTGLGYIGYILAAVVAIASTGLDLSSLAFVAGALSVGLGFGMQKVVENFTSGVLLLIERPIREGDWVEVGSYSGIVKKVSVRSTHIETFDRHRIIIPNSEFITGSVKNLSLGGGPTRIVVMVGVAYGSDLDQVRNAILDCAEAHENVLHFPHPVVAMDEFADSSINVKLLCFVADVTTGAGTASDLKFAIAKRFEQDGIEIPFPQRDLHIIEGAPVRSFTGSAGETGREKATVPDKTDVRGGDGDGDATGAGDDR